MSFEGAIKWLRILLVFFICGIVIENAPLFARMDGLSIKIALIVCALIIGLRVQRRINES